MSGLRQPPPARSLWQRLFNRDRDWQRRRAQAFDLYAAIVAQARQPVLYDAFAVPDTPEGRFEMIALHTSLLLRRLRAIAGDGSELSQHVFDIFVTDMDTSMREMGVGDLSVGKFVKRLAGNFYHRLKVMDDALDGSGATALRPMLAKNVYGATSSTTPAQQDKLARYLSGQDEWLKQRSDAQILAADALFAVNPYSTAVQEGVDADAAPA